MVTAKSNNEGYFMQISGEYRRGRGGARRTQRYKSIITKAVFEIRPRKNRSSSLPL